MGDAGAIHPPEAFFQESKDEDSEFSALAAPRPAPTGSARGGGGGVGAGDAGGGGEGLGGRDPSRPAHHLKRYAQSSKVIHNRIGGIGPFGFVPGASVAAGSNGALGMGTESKIPASLLVVGAVLLILYLFTPSFVTVPSASPLEIPKVSHVHVLLLALAAGVLTFALQFLMP